MTSKAREAPGLDQRAVLKKLSFSRTYPHDLIYSLNNSPPNYNLELSFCSICFDIHQCRALAAAEIRKITFLDCFFEDGGQAFVDSVKAGRGPRGLSLQNGTSRPLLDTVERCLSVIAALQGNQHLESLDIEFSYEDEGLTCAQALSTALANNKGLTHLGFFFFMVPVDRSGWIDILQAIATHPTLRTLRLGTIKNYAWVKLTDAMVEMMRTNNVLEEISFLGHDRFPSVFMDREVFRLQVLPQLDCNKFRKRFVAIQNIQDPSMRAAVVAKVLVRLGDKPSLIYMLLHDNFDSLVKLDLVPNIHILGKRKHLDLSDLGSLSSKY